MRAVRTYRDGHNVDVTVVVVIDEKSAQFDRMCRDLAMRARANKGGKAAIGGGAVRCEIVMTEGPMSANDTNSAAMPQEHGR